MGRKREALAGLERVCDHKLMDPAGSLTIVKARGQAAIRSSQPGATLEKTFALSVADFDTLVNWGFLKQDPHALRAADRPTAFHITDAGWSRYYELADRTSS